MSHLGHSTPLPRGHSPPRARRGSQRAGDGGEASSPLCFHLVLVLWHCLYWHFHQQKSSLLPPSATLAFSASLLNYLIPPVRTIKDNKGRRN